MKIYIKIIIAPIFSGIKVGRFNVWKSFYSCEKARIIFMAIWARPMVL